MPVRKSPAKAAKADAVARDYKSPDAKTETILRKAGITSSVKIAAAGTKSTDTHINNMLKSFGKNVRLESRELKKNTNKNRKSAMKSAKEDSLRKINA